MWSEHNSQNAAEIYFLIIRVFAPQSCPLCIFLMRLQENDLLIIEIELNAHIINDAELFVDDFSAGNIFAEHILFTLCYLVRLTDTIEL